MASRLATLASNLQSEFKTFSNQGKSFLTHEQQMLKEACEKSFYTFVKHAWIHLQGRPYIDGWHVGAITEHFQAVYNLQIRKLLFNSPPRVGKSLLLCSALPAWIWAIDPGFRFLYTSYAQKLTTRDSTACRQLISSPWYQSLWGNTYNLSKDTNSKLRFDTNKRGSRISSSVGGTITGEGGDLGVVDDPNNIKKIYSEADRTGVNDWFDFTFSTRFQLAATARQIVSQQRCHANDLSGHILAKNDPDWIHFCLPMEFEKSRHCVTIPLPISNGRIWMDPRKKEGELLWPEGMNAQAVKTIKINFNHDSYTIASQLQQRPSPADGGILKEEWFKAWKQRDLPEFEYILQSWDTALTSSKMSCYSAATTWGVFKDKGGINNIMLLSLFREKVEYPDLRKMATRLAHNYNDVYIDDPMVDHNPPHLILIEAKVSGYSLLADLMRANLPVMAFNPGKYGDKIGRCRLVSHLMENGLVWLPTEFPKCEYYTEDSQMFLEAATTFPNTESNDIIDSMSQAFIRLTGSGWITNKEDPVFQTEPNFNHDRPYH